MHTYTTYKNLGGDSGVEKYCIGEDFIIVKFKTGAEQYYKYTYNSAGSSAIEQMKVHARDGVGLNSYISTHKPGFEMKSIEEL